MQFIVDENTGDPVVNQIALNPFEKESFTTYREWEEALIHFRAEQSKAPDLMKKSYL